MAFPSIKSSYAHIWWLGLLCVVQALKVIILPLPLGAGVMCCPQLTFKPSLGRREKLPQKVGRREIYRPVPPPSNKDHQRVDNIFKCTSHFIFDFNLFIFNLNQLHLTNNSHYKKCAPHPRPKSLPVVLTYIVLFSLLNGITAKCSSRVSFRQWSVINPVELVVRLADKTKPQTPIGDGFLFLEQAEYEVILSS